MELYFTLAGSDAVEVLDPATNQIINQISVGSSPHFPLFTADGEYALVVVQGPGELAVVNPEDNAVIGDVSVGSMPHWIAATADGKTAYVTNEGSNDVSIVDVETKRSREPSRWETVRAKLSSCRLSRCSSTLSAQPPLGDTAGSAMPAPCRLRRPRGAAAVLIGRFAVGCFGLRSTRRSVTPSQTEKTHDDGTDPANPAL